MATETAWTQTTNKDYWTIITILEEMFCVFDENARFAGT